MRTITKTENQYQWNELSDKAKDHARYEYWGEYDNAGDAMASLRGFAEYFGSKLQHWSIDWANTSYSSVKFADVEPEPEELERLVSELKTDGSCRFTGFCFDDDCNDGAVKAYREGERDVMEILKAGFESWLKAAQSDYEYQQSDEAIAESCEANDYWFDESGNLV